MEVRRALTRYCDDELPDCSTLGDELIEVMDLIGMTAVLQEAGTPPPMRSLDAICLATALYLGNALNAFITCDKRSEEAAVAHDLPVVAPKDE